MNNDIFILVKNIMKKYTAEELESIMNKFYPVVE